MNKEDIVVSFTKYSIDWDMENLVVKNVITVKDYPDIKQISVEFDNQLEGRYYVEKSSYFDCSICKLRITREVEDEGYVTMATFCIPSLSGWKILFDSVKHNRINFIMVAR